MTEQVQNYTISSYNLQGRYHFDRIALILSAALLNPITAKAVLPIMFSIIHLWHLILDVPSIFNSSEQQQQNS